MGSKCPVHRSHRLILLCALSPLFFPLFSAAQAPVQAGFVKGTIGEAVLVLTGPWKFHPGDDMAWANPSFDDSGWDTQDLTPPAGSYDPITGSSGFVPGWTAQRYPKLTGYAWYRLRVQLQTAGAGAAVASLALDHAHQLRRRLPGLRQWPARSANSAVSTRTSVVFYNAQPRSFALPA